MYLPPAEVTKQLMSKCKTGTHMEPISAIDVLMNMNAIQHMRYIQIRPAVPPSSRPIWATLRTASHDAIRIMEKPKMERKLKFLFLHC